MLSRPHPSPPSSGFHPTSLAQQLATAIQSAITTGEFVEQLPSERELCERYRASRPIVRQAIHLLSAEGVVELRTKRRARILHPLPSRTLPLPPRRAALLFTKPSAQLSHWQLLLLDALKQELQIRGIILEPVHKPALAASTVVSKRLERLCTEFSARNIHQWILGGVPQAVQSWFYKRKIRAISMGNTFPNAPLPFVNDDLRSTTRHAAGIFLGLGHQEIGYLFRSQKSAGEREETEGFLSAFSPHPCRGYLIPHSGSVAAIRHQLKRLFSRQPAVTALLISHAEDTLVVMNWCMERGIRIPHDLSLISYQWESYLERLHPIPASYHSDPREHARKLSRLLRLPVWDHRPPSSLVIPVFRRNGTIAPLPHCQES